MGLPDGGLKIADGAFRVAADALIHIRMPLFTFISGYLFIWIRSTRKDTPAFLRDKVRRLLLPLVSVGIPFSLIQAVAPGVNRDVGITDALISFLVPVNHFWFLQAIFVVFFLCHAYARLFPRLLLKWYILLAISCGIYLYTDPPAFFSLNGAAYLLPFFVVGCIAAGTGTVERDRRWLGLIGLLLILVAQTWLAQMDPIAVTERRNLRALAVGVLSCILLYRMQGHSRLLVLIGTYSFAIYLFHPLFAVASRLLLRRIGIEEHLVLVPAGFILAIVGPVVLARFLLSQPLLATLFLGERYAPPLGARRTRNS